MNYIYRHVNLSRSTKDNVHKLIKDIVQCKASIISMGSLCNGYPESKFGYWETFYSIQFLFQSDLDDFVSRGWKVREQELTSNNLFPNVEAG